MQLIIDIDKAIYEDMSLLLSAAHGLSVEEYLEGHLIAYRKMLNSKHEGQEQFCELELVAHYLYHEVMGDKTISEEEFP